MNRTIGILIVVLLLQLGLAVGLKLAGNEPAGSGEEGKLLAFSAEQIDRLTIEDGEGKQLLLQKVQGRWTLPTHFGAPADSDKIGRLLSTLLGIQRTWPVAASEDAHKRFKVADGDYERRLQFASGDRELATLLLGSSPGFRKVHARLAGEQQVFDIPFSTYQAGLKALDWLDKKVLELEPNLITAVELDDFRLVREEGELKVAGLAATEKTDAVKAWQLVDRLARVRILDVYAKADHPLPAPVALSLRLELQDGTARQYDFAQGKEEGYALLKVSDAPYLYKVSTTLLKELQATNRADLVQAKDAPGSPAAEQTTPPLFPRG